MSAKEMFEALGFQEINTGNRNWLIRFNKVVRINDDDYKDVNISFWISDKFYECTDWANGPDLDIWGSHINSELHQAITQQMKELGWI